MSKSNPNCDKCREDTGRKFCPECGRKIRCPQCKAFVKQQAKFCEDCGHPLNTPSSTAEDASVDRSVNAGGDIGTAITGSSNKGNVNVTMTSSSQTPERDGSVSRKTAQRKPGLRDDRSVNAGGKIGAAVTSENNEGNIYVEFCESGDQGSPNKKSRGPVTNIDFRGATNPQVNSGDFRGKNQHFGSGSINEASTSTPTKTGDGAPSIASLREKLGFRRKEPSQSELRKSHDDSTSMAYIDKLSKMGKSVGCIWSPVCQGTGFRVGTDYILTCWHVIRDIRDKIGVVGERKGFEDIYRNDNAWIQFDYAPGDERLPSNANRFQFARVTIFNEELDYAVVQLDTSCSTPPPAIERFSRVQADEFVQLIGHNKGSYKKLDPNCKVFQPSQQEIDTVEQNLQNYLHRFELYNMYGYTGMLACAGQRIHFQCGFEQGASGSPAAVRRNDGLVVVAMLARGYPAFYYGLTDEYKRRVDLDLPISCFMEEGVDIMKILEDIRQRDFNVYNTLHVKLS